MWQHGRQEKGYISNWDIQCQEHPHPRGIHSENNHALYKMVLQDPGQRPPKEELDNAYM